MEHKVLAYIRDLIPDIFLPSLRTDQQLAVNNRGELLIAQALPPNVELVRLGNSWWTKLTTATAPVIVEPTTASLLSLWNGEPDTGYCYILDSIFGYKVANDASASGMLALAMLNVAKTTAPADAALAINSMIGRKAGQTLARTVVGASGLVNDGWQSIGYPSPSVPTATVSIGQGYDIDLLGKYIVRPGGYFHHSCLAAVATATSIKLGVRWHEAILKFRS